MEMRNPTVSKLSSLIIPSILRWGASRYWTEIRIVTTHVANGQGQMTRKLHSLEPQISKRNRHNLGRKILPLAGLVGSTSTGKPCGLEANSNERMHGTDWHQDLQPDP